jgi:hypothetical protein
MAVTTIPTAGLTLGAQVNFRNLIINGDMSIAQRSTSATSISSSGYHALDRFRFGFTDTDQLVATISQDTDVPSGQGFSKSMKFLVTTVESALDANDALQIQYRIEGQNLQQLKYGTSSAESLTLSFWVKSSVTGTYALTFKNSDDGGTKLNVNTYSISSANTWEKKTITISGDTATNIDNTNGNKLEVLWGLTAGSNYKGTSSSGWTSYSASKLFNGQTADIATTSSANFYITGVQLEVGTSASDFEFLPHDVNMQRCMRYLQHTPFITGANSMTAPTNEGIEIMGARHKFADVHGFRSETITHYVPMRVQPSFTFYNPSNSGTTGQFRLYDKDGNTQDFSGFAQLWDRYGFNMGGYTGVSVGTAGDTVWILGMHWKADAEL